MFQSVSAQVFGSSSALPKSHRPNSPKKSSFIVASNFHSVESLSVRRCSVLLAKGVCSFV
jgi:hypothetical protein